jgi:hypothetical protein
MWVLFIGIADYLQKASEFAANSNVRILVSADVFTMMLANQMCLLVKIRCKLLIVAIALVCLEPRKILSTD